VVVDDRIVDLSVALAVAPKDIIEILRDEKLRSTIGRLAPTPQNSVALAGVELEAPIVNPSKYLAIGMNYQDHADEARKAGIPIPKVQVWFNKQVSCITGPFAPIHLPPVTEKLDYEAELGVVIGKRCRHVRREAVRDVIGGYFVANDVTARDWQQASPTWTLGKSFDTHGPIGPWIVTADEIPDPHALQMKLFVNGELRQSASTGLMIHDIYAQIAHLTTVMTLEPGDLIATGTCSGVGIARTPPTFLKIGDVVRVEIERLGHIENTVVVEPAGG
jgi:2-keto-4-pentenoate hydratase/2-oxohepta-3-ene-1,7-dioic acid hydratase in catechol pathway